MITRLSPLSAETSVLADKRQVRVVCSTPETGRDGIVLVSEGMDLTHYRTNPVVLWQHDPDQPVARALQIGVRGENLEALVQFPDEGVSAKADEIYGLIRAGVINAVSTGFDPLESEALDPRRPAEGERITRSELLEFSFVTIPAVRNAVITERAMPRQRAEADWRVGADRKLPIDEKMSWDGPAAAERVFSWAGFNDATPKPDPDRAKRAFLAYDAAKPDDKGSYKLPFADMIEGELRAVREGLDDAASRLPQTDLPASVREDARQVIADYEAADADVPPERAIQARIARSLVRRGLYEVASLAYLVNELGWVRDSATFEAEIEGDASKVPAMLGDALARLGAALKAMTAEEVDELLAGADEGDDIVAEDDEAEIVTASASAAQRRMRLARARAARLAARADRLTPKQRLYRQRLAHLRRIAGADAPL